MMVNASSTLRTKIPKIILVSSIFAGVQLPTATADPTLLAASELVQYPVDSMKTSGKMGATSDAESKNIAEWNELERLARLKTETRMNAASLRKEMKETN